jgi:hypothetical protein
MAVQQQQQQNHEQLGKVIDALLDAITGFNATITYISIHGIDNYADYAVGIDLPNSKLLIGYTINDNKARYRLCLDDNWIDMDNSLLILVSKVWNRITNNPKFYNMVELYVKAKQLSNIELLTVSCQIPL